MIAIGRGEGLFGTIDYLQHKGLKFDLIISDTEYAEYTRTAQDYADLAKRIGAEFWLLKKFDDAAVKELTDDLLKRRTKVAISANWRHRLPKAVIDAFEWGILNCHMGRLPDYKGNAPASWMILQGEREMYVDVHKMDVLLDCGDIISRRVVPISDETYVGDLWQACNENMPLAFEEALQRLAEDPNYRLTANSTDGLRCFPRNELDHEIDWTKPAEQVARLVRASSRPYSGAYTFIDDKKVIIWRAKAARLPYTFLAAPGHVLVIDKSSGTVMIACGQDVLELEEIEIDGEIMVPTKFFKSIRKRCTAGSR